MFFFSERVGNVVVGTDRYFFFLHSKIKAKNTIRTSDSLSKLCHLSVAHGSCSQS